MNISEVMDKWLEVSKAKKHPKTISMHYEPFVRYYLEIVGDHPVSEFSIDHSDKFITGLRAKNLNEVTTNMKLQRLITFMNWAYDRDYLTKLLRIEKLKEPKKLPNILSLEEVQELFERLIERQKNARNAHLRRCNMLHQRALMLYVSTGMRRSEVFYLKWAQVDFGRKFITVKHQDQFTVKEKKEKRVECPDYLLSFLQKQRSENPKEIYILDDGKGNIMYEEPGGLTQAFSRHYKALGWKEREIKPLHGFRALFIDRLFNDVGVDLHLVQGMVGHSNPRVTELYLPTTDKRHKKVAKKVDEFDKDRLFKSKTLARLRSTN